jgi:cytochrome c-type biogenesis protein CcmH
MRQLLMAFILMLGAAAVSAETPALDQAEVEARSAKISKTLRCVVCQNQSIYDSEATLAQDMRSLVEKRVIAGDSDEEVRDYLRERYGDFVLMTPPLQSNTWLLWFGPLGLMVLAVIWFVLRLRSKAAPSDAAELSAEDRERVRAALADDKEAAS